MYQQNAFKKSQLAFKRILRSFKIMFPSFCPLVLACEQVSFLLISVKGNNSNSNNNDTKMTRLVHILL